MDPWAPARPPQPPRGGWGEAHHRHPSQPFQQLLHKGPQPRSSSWDGSHLPNHPWDEGHQPWRDTHGPTPWADYPNWLYSRQGYEDPDWQYPAGSYGGDYTYQSHQWQPVAWQGDRDLRQRERYGKSTKYQDHHYYRGYHPNLATSPPGQERTQAYGSHKENYIPAARREQSGGGTLCSDLREAGGQPQEPSDPPSLLLKYQELGLSSSTYELSQYIHDGADHHDPTPSETWSPAPPGRSLVSTPAPVVPLKFSLPHVAMCFGAGGQLVLVCPHCPAEGQQAHVELHSLEVILHDTKELEELQAFPGPLVREDLHKVDVMTFCQQKIATGCDLSTQRGRDSALLWKLLVVLCQQNGSMVGSDTAELLMQDCKCREKYKRKNPEANLMGLTDEEWMSHQPGTLDLITGEVPPVVETQAQIVEKFTKLLYYGRKKDALVWAMRNHLWGHALFLSSKMDPRTYSWVLTGFTSTLATNDPLQTLFQLMSGRIPQAALCCGDATWGDWRPHLAVMLSNKAGDMELNHQAIITMGDTLAGKGAVEAAHFCYLMADIPFGYFGAKADHMVLLGSSHRQTFTQFATTEAIQRMEILEYCQQLRQPESFLLPFQVYKLLYASRLADHGLPAQALQYCEQIATALLGQGLARHPVLAQQVMKLAERLKLSDPLLLEMPEKDQNLEPEWLEQLRACCQEWEMKNELPLEVTPTQPGLSWAASSRADERPGQELPQGEGYQYNQRYHAMPPQGPSSHEDVAALPHLSVRQELQPSRQVFTEPPLQVVSSAGEAGESWGTLLSPEGVQPSLPTEQEELKARARTMSESSTISLEDGSQNSSESTAEDADGEPKEVNKEEDKSSGFRWFGWFWLKPTKEKAPKATSEAAPDSPVPEPQERTSPSPQDTPLTAGTNQNPLAQPLFGNPGGMQGDNSFPAIPASTEVKGLWGADGGEAAGQQTTSQESLPVGTIPLFNPLQVSQLAAASRPNQPRLLSQRRYPNPL
ncbi:protein transport protein Sec16B isoform X2 [Calypte anna]|uniref:protein transport protein Sec16B isoform X2 n=1 Tax=Calypte anna TaxID=9244 RepID=UPI0011C3FE13|nr:protein transport protein Sec16B isoform X2 [Calypte anna]